MPRSLSPAAVEIFRSRLCDVAEERFAAHGPDGVTMREMADALGVSSMTPYRYFKDKDAILAAVRTRAFNQFAAAMESASRTKAKPGNAYVEFAIAHAAPYRLMFDVSQPNFADYPQLVAAMERARLTMGAELRELAAAGRFKGDVGVGRARPLVGDAWGRHARIRGTARGEQARCAKDRKVPRARHWANTSD